MMVSHRFRSKENTWPCYQVGLGIFTVNQVKDGYDWPPFKESIKTGLEIFNQADPEKMDKVKDSLSVVLRYQDGFYPKEGESIEKYLEKHFHVKAELPDEFLNNKNIVHE